MKTNLVPVLLGAAVGSATQLASRPPKDGDTWNLKQSIHDGLYFKIGLAGLFGGVLVATLCPKHAVKGLTLMGIGAGLAGTSFVQSEKKA